MKLNVSRESLKAALDVCGKLVNQKAHLEVLRCIRIDSRDGKASVSATNLEEWATVELEGARVEAEGSGVIGLAELKLFVKDAGHGDEVGIEADGADIKVSAEIAGNRISRDFKAQKLEDWPEFPAQPSQLFNASSGFMEAIRQAAPSTSSKDFRRALACVYVNEGQAVATDGHHLVAVPCKSPFEKGFLIKPTKMLDILKGECRVGIKQVEKGKGTGKLSVHCGNIAWTVSLSDAEYPNWHQVLPNEKSLALSVLFDTKSAAEFLRAIPALKSKEGAIALRCGPDGVFAGSSCELAAFRTDALFSGSKPFNIELSAANLSRALGLGMLELRMNDAFSPVLFKSEKGAFMASMPLRQKATTNTKPAIKEEITMPKKEEASNTQTTVPAVASTSNGEPGQGFSVVKTQQTDLFDELLKSAEEVKAVARASYESAAQFARKIREVQSSIRRKDREQKSTKELIEKLKTVSGF